MRTREDADPAATYCEVIYSGPHAKCSANVVGGIFTASSTIKNTVSDRHRVCAYGAFFVFKKIKLSLRFTYWEQCKTFHLKAIENAESKWTDCKL